MSCKILAHSDGFHGALSTPFTECNFYRFVHRPSNLGCAEHVVPPRFDLYRLRLARTPFCTSGEALANLLARPLGPSSFLIHIQMISNMRASFIKV